MTKRRASPSHRLNVFGRIAGLCLIFALGVSNAYAAERIRSVDVVGNKRIEKETVILYMGIKTGQEATPAVLDQGLKKLFQSTLFDDVKLEMKGSRLVVTVAENPIVSEVFFEGNDKLSDEQLSAEMTLKPRSVFTKARIRQDTQRILELYRRVGRYRATVEPKTIQREHNRVDVVMEIKEGKPSYIEKISFVGNKALSTSELKDAIMSKEHRFWRFLSSTDTYDPDRTSYDKELLRRYYHKKGYADFEITSSVAELLPDKSGFTVSFYIHEGARYKVSDIKVESHISDVKVKKLEKLITFKPKTVYNSDEVEKTIQKMTDELGMEGYAFVNIDPVLKKDKENKTLSINFLIKETPKIFVDKINITGNVRTEDKVIRREFRLSEGDAFNTAKLRRSKQRLENLGYFERVDFKMDPTGHDKTNIGVDLSEKSTGSINLAIGYSTSNGALITAGIKEQNLLGKGYEIGLSGTLSEKQQQVDFSFTNPYFLDKDLVAGIDLYVLTRDRKSESSYDWKAEGGAVRFGFNYNEDWRQALRYTLRDETIENVSSSASNYVKRRAGESTVSMINQTITYDKRDNRFMPSDGYYISLSTDVAGLGGTEKFYRYDVNAGYYYPVSENVTFALSGTYGHVHGYDGQEVKLNYRYYLGGDNLRGFKQAGAGGGRDMGTDDALGGNWIFNASAQLLFPIGFPKEVGVRGRIFFDTGTLGKPDSLDSSSYYSSAFRSSVGFGIVWNSMLGPIVLDWGWAINKQPYDETERFRISFGMSF